MAETKLLSQCIQYFSPKPGTDYYCEVDEELYKDRAEMLPVFNELDNITADIFLDSDGSEDCKVLWHG